MNSEKVKEIKMALEFCKDLKSGCENCPYHEHGNDCVEMLTWDMEDYINELENLCNKTYEDLTKEIDRLESENERLDNLFDAQRIVAKQRLAKLEKAEHDRDRYQRRIAELEKEIEENAFYSKGYAQGIKNTYEVVIPDKLKQFAERLKEKCEFNRKEYCCDATVSARDIDETLKEFLL